MSPDRQDRIFIVSQGEINGALSADFYSNKSSFSGLYSTLKEISEINPNRKNEKFLDNDLVPYVGLPETDDGEIKNVILRPYKEVKGRNIIKKGDILFARIEPSIFNKKYIFVDNLKGYDYAFTSTEFYIIKGNSKVNQKFLYYQLFTDNVYNQFAGKTTGSTGRRRLDRLVFENIQIPLPPLKTQEKIVDKMNSALAEKKNLENKSDEILNSIDDYVLSELGIELEKKEEKMYFSVDLKDIIENNRFDPSYFTNSFKIKKSDYELKNIYDIAEIKKGQSITQDNIIEGKYPVIAGGQTSPYSHSQKNYDGNVITISASGAYSGYVRYHENPIFASDCSVVFSKNEKLISTFFIYTWLKINQKEIYKMQKGAGQPHVYSDDIGNFIIPLPPREIQDKITNEVKSRIEKARQLKNQATEIYEQTKNEVEKMILK